jgi:hypothetical protein
MIGRPARTRTTTYSMRPATIHSGPTTRAPGCVPSATTQAMNASTVPTTDVIGISRPRIHMLPFIRNGRGMSGATMRSQTTDAWVSMNAIRMPKL